MPNLNLTTVNIIAPLPDGHRYHCYDCDRATETIITITFKPQHYNKNLCEDCLVRRLHARASP